MMPQVYVAVSIQARILNQMIDEAFQGSPMAEKRLRELIGHTPVQVFVGALVGIGIGLLMTHLKRSMYEAFAMKHGLSSFLRG